jgi:fumarylacetoacetase
MPESRKRVGVAIGEFVFDVGRAYELKFINGLAAQAAAASDCLNDLLALEPQHRIALRQQIFGLLRKDSTQAAELRSGSVLRPIVECTLHLPTRIGGFTDFFSGIHHAINAGRQLRPNDPLSPNYKYVPIAYHSRASSVRVSGAGVRRPRGQQKPTDGAPVYQPTRALDYELELALWISGANDLGNPINIDGAPQHLAGFGLLNDWSARDLQRWEAQPLGPFLAKNFMTSISPWIITAEALEPFRCAMPSRPPGDPAPLPHLWSDNDQARGAFAIEMEVALQTNSMRTAGLPPHRLSSVSTLELYWTASQLIAHHTSNGCNLEPGDLFGSGTISPPDQNQAGCLLERTRGGTQAIELPNGERRIYLEDGDEVIFTAHCNKAGFATIGFGENRGRILSAIESVHTTEAS